MLEWCGIENMEYSQFQQLSFSSVLGALGIHTAILDFPKFVFVF